MLKKYAVNKGGREKRKRKKREGERERYKERVCEKRERDGDMERENEKKEIVEDMIPQKKRNTYGDKNNACESFIGEYGTAYLRRCSPRPQYSSFRLAEWSERKVER